VQPLQAIGGQPFGLLGGSTLQVRQSFQVGNVAGLWGQPAAEA